VIRKPQGKRSFWNSRRLLEYNIKIDLRYIDWGIKTLHEMNSLWVGYNGTVVGFCNDGDESSGSIKEHLIIKVFTIMFSSKTLHDEI
jgi:hypothetical protein